jgi:hypothetical protein
MTTVTRLTGPPLPRVFRANDGSVAVQDVTAAGWQVDGYMLAHIGPEAALLGFVRGMVTTGELLITMRDSLMWREMHIY